jgi:hypothetical protein
MQFIKTDDAYPNGVKTIYFPLDAGTNYRCITVATPYLLTPEDFAADKPADPARVRELDLSKKVFFFEFFQGQQVTQMMPIQHQNVKHAPGQKTYPVEKPVTITNYHSEPVGDPKAVAQLEAWLEQNTI